MIVAFLLFFIDETSTSTSVMGMIRNCWVDTELLPVRLRSIAAQLRFYPQQRMLFCEPYGWLLSVSLCLQCWDIFLHHLHLNLIHRSSPRQNKLESLHTLFLSRAKVDCCAILWEVGVGCQYAHMKLFLFLTWKVWNKNYYSLPLGRFNT